MFKLQLKTHQTSHIQTAESSNIINRFNKCTLKFI